MAKESTTIHHLMKHVQKLMSAKKGEVPQNSKRNNGSRFTIKNSENLYLWVAQLRHHQENTDMYGLQ